MAFLPLREPQYTALTGLVLPCAGGMKADIFDSMAEGVTNAACLVCFMTQAYQDSANCALELKFAKQSGIPIVRLPLQ